MATKPKTATPPPMAEPQDAHRGNELMVEAMRSPAFPEQTRMAVTGLGLALSMPVVSRRNHDQIMVQLRALAISNGPRYIYRWQARDRKKGTLEEIKGPTIKLANDLCRVYGNCFVGVVDVRDQGDHWEFIALFVDRETGFMMSRSFQQRKGQDTGMRDAERARDNIYQIGCSKAIRNVAVNALDNYANFMEEEADKNLIQYITGNREKCEKFIDQVAEKHGIGIVRIERRVGRPRKEWTIPDMARVMGELRSVEDSMVSVEDLFPSEETATRRKEMSEEQKGEDAPKNEATAAARPPAEDKPGPPKQPESMPQAEAPASELSNLWGDQDEGT